MDNATKKEFSTMDIYFSGYLVLRKGLEYTMRTGDKGKVMFVFDLGRQEAFDLMKEFHNDTQIYDYVQQVKYLRGQMNESRSQKIEFDPINLVGLKETV